MHEDKEISESTSPVYLSTVSRRPRYRGTGLSERKVRPTVKEWHNLTSPMIRITTP